MYRRVTWSLLAALFAFHVYRAATQSFTTDEAFSYRLYVGAEPFSLFQNYDANLHVLHTLLCWLSVKLLGLSELTFRVPSLAACALYYAGVYRLCSLAFRRGPLFLLGAALLTLNPLVFDHMSVGRGYGLALAFFVWAMAGALCAVQDSDPERPLLRVAVLVALSVASNLTFLFPAAALIMMLIVWRPRLPNVAANLTGPAVVFTFLLLVMPLSRLEPGQFYFGTRSLGEMNQTLLAPTFGVSYANPLWTNSGIAVLFAGSAVAVAVLWRRAREGPFLLLCAGTLLLTAGALAAGHIVFGILYPWARTGLYFLFLAPLFLLAAAGHARGVWRIAMLVLVAAAGVAMMRGISWRGYLEWPFDASSREMALRIRDRRGAAAAPVRIASSPPMDKTLGIYRAMYGFDWMTEIADTPSAPGFDYYVLRDQDRQLAAENGLREVFVSGQTGVALAVPAGDR